MQVARLSRKLNWNGVSVDVMLRFLKGCGIELCHTQKISQNMKRTATMSKPFCHLDSQQLRKFLCRMKQFREARALSCSTQS